MFLFFFGISSVFNDIFEGILHCALLLVAKVLRKLVLNLFFVGLPFTKEKKTAFHDCLISAFHERLVTSFKKLKCFVLFQSAESSLNRSICLRSPKISYHLSLFFL
jgi:RNase H-fold protein (predicted Holliday junction resolvase)